MAIIWNGYSQVIRLDIKWATQINPKKEFGICQPAILGE